MTNIPCVQQWIFYLFKLGMMQGTQKKYPIVVLPLYTKRQETLSAKMMDQWWPEHTRLSLVMHSKWKGHWQKMSNGEWFSCVEHGSSWSFLKNLRACHTTSHSCYTLKIICSPAIKSWYISSEEMVKASTTSKGILLPSWQLLKSVATLLKVLVAQELTLFSVILISTKATPLTTPIFAILHVHANHMQLCCHAPF